MSTSTRFELEFGLPQVDWRRRAEQGMRILLMGDFSARSALGAVEQNPRIDERPIVPIDVDNIDGVLWRLAPRISLALEGADSLVEMEFHGLEDFHPDTLCKRLPLFQRLMELRQRLLDPTTFGEAAAALQQELRPPLADRRKADNAAESESWAAESDEDAVERLLGKQTGGVPGRVSDRPSSASGVDVEAFIRKIVAPHVVPAARPHQEVYLQSVNEVISVQMRSLLHTPAFQSLESAWRSVYSLVTNLETGEDLKLYLLDVCLEELTADIGAAGGDLRASGLHRLLVDRGVGTPGGEHWSLLVGDYAFGTSDADVTSLAALGAMGAQAGGAFIAEAKPQILGCQSVAQTPDPADWNMANLEGQERWLALRESSIASRIGLALPRVLQRLPYGEPSDPVDSLDFEELSPDRRHEEYLWGNPAFACALLLAQAYSASGWAMTPGDYLDVEDLPAHAYTEAGESVMQACAEVYLSERAGHAILDRGVMPLLSYRGRNAVRVARFQSIAAPAGALAGPWS